LEKLITDIKINYRLLSACNKDFIADDGTKIPYIKLLAFYAFLKNKYKSSHIHYTSRRAVDGNFTSKTTFSKYCSLLLEAGFAKPHSHHGIILQNMQYVTDGLCGEKCTGRRNRVIKEKWIRVKVANKTLKSVIKKFNQELYLQKLNQIRYRVMSDYVKNSREPIGILNLKFAESHKHYNTSLMKISNKTLGKYFNRSRSYAKKVKQAVSDTYQFACKFVNLGPLKNSKYESVNGQKAYEFVKPSFYLHGLHPVKNLGQRVIILK